MCKIHLATIMISTHNILFFVSVLISSTITRGEVVSESNTTTVSSVPEYANYGEPCTKITDCDASAYHTCVNGSCLCALTEAMKFDDASSSCWVLPGQKCVYRASEVGLSLMVDAAIGEERTIRGDRISFRCVSNSACEGKPFCKNNTFGQIGSGIVDLFSIVKNDFVQMDSVSVMLGTFQHKTEHAKNSASMESFANPTQNADPVCI